MDGDLRHTIHFERGAVIIGIGDDLMSSGIAREAQQTDPRKVRPMLEKGFRWAEIWRHNPRIAQPGEQGDFQNVIVRAHSLRRYMAAKTPTRWTWREYRPPPGEIYFSGTERTFGLLNGGRIVLEPHIKAGASPNKRWSWVAWNKLAWLLGRQNVRVTQLGPSGTPLLEGVDFVSTNDFRMAAAVLSTARAAVVHEGGLHHAAAAVGLRNVIVIRGAFISQAVTGYDGQIDFFTGDGLGCGMRTPCKCCEDAMARIKPEAVAEQLLEMLNAGQRADRSVAENAA